MDLFWTILPYFICSSIENEEEEEEAKNNTNTMPANDLAAHSTVYAKQYSTSTHSMHEHDIPAFMYKIDTL